MTPGVRRGLAQLLLAPVLLAVGYVLLWTNAGEATDIGTQIGLVAFLGGLLLILTGLVWTAVALLRGR